MHHPEIVTKVRELCLDAIIADQNLLESYMQQTNRSSDLAGVLSSLAME